MDRTSPPYLGAPLEALAEAAPSPRRPRLLSAFGLVLLLLVVVWLDYETGPEQEFRFFYVAVIVLAGLEFGSVGLLMVPLAFSSYLGNEVAYNGLSAPHLRLENSLVTAASWLTTGAISALARQARLQVDTQRRILAMALAERDAALKCLPDLMLVLDGERRIQGVGGRPSERLARLGAEHVVGLPLGDLPVGPSGAEGLSQLLASLDPLEKGLLPRSPSSPAARLALEDRTVEAYPLPMRAASGELRGWAILLRDVTERLRTERLLLSRARSLAVQETKQQLARHLHDSVAQTLAALRIRLDLLAASGGAAEVTALQAGEVRAMLAEAIRELRQTMWELRPTLLEKLPLEEALRAYLGDLEARSGLKGSLEMKGAVQLQPDREVLLFRVIQEAVTNAMKHSRAEAVEVRLEALEEGIQVEVKDEGVGFDPAEAGADPLHRSFGLRDMQDRARMLGTELAIESSPGQGTRIRFSIPRDSGPEEQ